MASFEGIGIYTVGHSNHRLEDFILLLKHHGIELVVDVRSRPVSRFAPFANIRSLPARLGQEGIRHAYMGGSLGGKPSDPALHDVDGQPDYGKIASTPVFKEGVGELVRLAQGRRIALMCAEEDPARCHRRLLLGPALEERGVRLLHIRRDGTVEG